MTEKYYIGYNASGAAIKSHGYRAMRNAKLKEMYIVRYADDFRIFCRTRENAVKTMAAVKQWLEERLRLEVSADKTRVVNLKKQYSDFLGIKMRLKQNKDKLVVKSHVCDKATMRIHAEATQKMREIRRPKGKTEYQAITAYNTYVMGVHNYYQMATDVSLDFHQVANDTAKVAKHLCKRLKRAPESPVKDAIVERYGASAQMRWISNHPIAPISYVRTKAPMCKKRSVRS